MNHFSTLKFSLGQNVSLLLSGEKGIVIGRAEYSHQAPSYFVRYLTADGRQVESWWDESALIEGIAPEPETAAAETQAA